MADFEISTEGTSRTTILKLHGVPIARFYAGRTDQRLLDTIARRLNADDTSELDPFYQMFVDAGIIDDPSTA